MTFPMTYYQIGTKNAKNQNSKKREKSGNPAFVFYLNNFLAVGFNYVIFEMFINIFHFSRLNLNVTQFLVYFDKNSGNPAFKMISNFSPIISTPLLISLLLNHCNI